MKKYLYIILAAVLILLSLSSVIFIQSKRIKKFKEQNLALTTNMLAFSEENSKLKQRNVEFQLSVDQLKFYNDSLLQKMDEARKQLKIKDKEIKRLGYLSSVAARVDTIRFTDTLFRDSVVQLDTTIRDKDGWYSCDVGLKFPNEISVSPTFKSEKYVITHVNKETVNPPKKCWLGRLFQKKHNVVIVDVVENNPYITSEKERFISVN